MRCSWVDASKSLPDFGHSVVVLIDVHGDKFKTAAIAWIGVSGDWLSYHGASASPEIVSDVRWWMALPPYPA